MNSLSSFLQSMSVWNWLAVAAFLIALMSGLNAFLTLKSRFRDWRGTKSKKQFEKRTTELRTQLFMLEKFKKNPTEFFVRVLNDSTRPAISFLIAFALFVIDSLLTPMIGSGAWVPKLLVFLMIISSITEATSVAQLIRRMNYPELFAMEVIDFVHNASLKGLKSTDADELVFLTSSSDIYSNVEREFVFTYLGKKFADVLALVAKTSGHKR